MGLVNISSLLAISIHVQIEKRTIKQQQCLNIQGHQANGDSHGLRVMSETTHSILQADKGAPNATDQVRRSSAALALSPLARSEVL